MSKALIYEVNVYHLTEFYLKFREGNPHFKQISLKV